MKLMERSVAEFMDLMGSDAPAPGGGSAAALSAAQGIALTAMVCALTVGRAKYAEFEDEAIAVGEKATAMKNEFLDYIERDTAAFNGFGAVYAMPKHTDEEKATRKVAMQNTLKQCTIVPVQMMELCMKALELTKSMIGRSNTNAVSDLGCAAIGLKSAIQSAWLNVLINVPSIQDETFVAEYRGRAECVIQNALPLADEIYDAVQNSL